MISRVISIISSQSKPEQLIPALYAGFVALMVVGIIGGLAFTFQEPWLFPSLGPTIMLHIVTPKLESSRMWNTLVGHAIGVIAAFLTLALLGALHAPSAMTAGHIDLQRIVAGTLAVALTVGAQIPLRSIHPPAAATALLVALGGLQANFATVAVLVMGVISSTVLCSCCNRTFCAARLKILPRSGTGPR